MEMESEYFMKVKVESMEFHGYLRDGSGSANACIIRCILSDRVYIHIGLCKVSIWY